MKQKQPLGMEMHLLSISLFAFRMWDKMALMREMIEEMFQRVRFD